MKGGFEYEGQRLAYETYGDGPKLTVLLHGLLFSKRMHDELARALADRGHRVVTLDLLGHGESDRPADMERYSMTEFGREVVALLDHALIGCAVAFTPLMLGLTLGAPVARMVARAARLVPARRLPWQVDILLDWVRQDPEPSAAVIQGLFFGRTAPHRDERRTFQAPTLVIGHQFDIVHPFSDAGMLAEELPNGRLLQANSIVELRLAPERLTDEIAAFLDECWKPRAAKAA